MAEKETMTLKLPDFKESEIHVTTEKEDDHTYLVVKAEHEEKKELSDDGKSYESSHRSFFYRSLLSSDVKKEDLQSSFKDGLLTVTFPKLLT